jgi:hypothetical protein
VRGSREDVGEHLLGVRRNVGDLVDLAHDAVRRDEERQPLGEVGPLLVVALLGAVGRTDGPVDVRQELVREALLLLERLVLRWSVEGDAEDDRIGLGERWGSITEPLAFDRSARRRGLRIPPQHDPLPGQVRQRHGVAVLIGEREGGCVVAFVHHGPTV